MGEKVYITGINGFLGRTLAGKLLEAGCEVCGLRLLQDDRDLLTEVHLCQFRACDTGKDWRTDDKRDQPLFRFLCKRSLWEKQGRGSCLCEKKRPAAGSLPRSSILPE